MLSLFRFRAGSSALRVLPSSSRLSRALPSSLPSSLSSSSCVPARSMFMHFTEEERAEQEDLVLNDSSSMADGSSGRSHSLSSSHAASSSSSSSMPSMHALARASEPSDVVKQRLRADDFNGDNTQDVLNAAGYTQQQLLHTLHADEREHELHH